MRPITPSIFLPELFLSTVFADGPFPICVGVLFADRLIAVSPRSSKEGS
jgi:hypothetical protein